MDWTTPRQSCGTSGFLRTAGDLSTAKTTVAWSASGDRSAGESAERQRPRWRRSVNGADDAISPRWTCVAAGRAQSSPRVSTCLLQECRCGDDALRSSNGSGWCTRRTEASTSHRGLLPRSRARWMEGQTLWSKHEPHVGPGRLRRSSHIARSHMRGSPSDIRSRTRKRSSCRLRSTTAVPEGAVHVRRHAQKTRNRCGDLGLRSGSGGQGALSDAEEPVSG